MRFGIPTSDDPSAEVTSDGGSGFQRDDASCKARRMQNCRCAHAARKSSNGRNGRRCHDSESCLNQPRKHNASTIGAIGW
eukprot:3162563-Pleurochrysis_carterae.AAC.2